MQVRSNLAILVWLGAATLASAADGTFTRVWPDQTVTAPAASPVLPMVFQPPAPLALTPNCPQPTSFHNTGFILWGDVPGIGSVFFNAGNDGMNINDLGQAAFFGSIDNPDRNQGIFVTDGTTIRSIAIGCGGGGGSGQPGSGAGDPSPIGGTFSGIFPFTCALNNLGDVLFMSDIDRGSSPRGLFLYRGATHQIVEIVAVGDPSPAGGTITSLGLGSINNNGDVVLLAEHNGASGPVHILKWSNGTLSALVRIGDPAPRGGTYSLIGREYFTYADNTRVYIGNVPGINNAGQVAFFSLVSGGIAERGIFLLTGGVAQWFLQAGDSTPAGGTYLDFWQPLLNSSGQVAIFCDILLGPGQTTSSWIQGTPGNFRKVLAFFDTLDGGSVMGLAVSRNPARALDDCGNLIVYASVHMPDGSDVDHTLFCPGTGATPLVIAKSGQSTPIGGNYNGMNAWPAMANRLVGMYGAYTPGSGYPNAYFKFQGLARGDLNCDGVVNFGDINPFVLALTGQAAYEAAFPNCRWLNADCNADGTVNFGDINPFVTCLTQGACP